MKSSRRAALLLLGPTSSGKTPTRLDDADLDVINLSLRTGALLESEHFPIARKLLVAFANQRNMSADDLLILNGLPRHVSQTDDVDAFVHIERVVILDCSAHDIQRRIVGDPGGDRAACCDDDPALVARKLATYQARTMPLVQH